MPRNEIITEEHRYGNSLKLILDKLGEGGGEGKGLANIGVKKEYLLDAGNDVVLYMHVQSLDVVNKLLFPVALHRTSEDEEESAQHLGMAAT